MTYVFAGPSISAGVQIPPGMVVLPPVALGGVYRVVAERPKAIGIIDGLFERSPAVTHKEILWALSNGIHVFGASSMGALRAAELEAFGMVGVGKIFAAYRDGLLEDDDEVAVAHATAEDKYRLASDAMVNIRATIENALAQRVIDTHASAILLHSAKTIYYPFRTYPAMIERSLAAGLPELAAQNLAAWLPTGKVDQKRLDAIELLSVMAQFTSRRPRVKKASFTFHKTQMWDFAMRQCEEMDRESLSARAGVRA